MAKDKAKDKTRSGDQAATLAAAQAADPPSGFAADGRPENPRPYPPGTYPGNPGAASAGAGTGLLAEGQDAEVSPLAGTRYIPPGGFAIDGRPENPRVFPAPPGPQGHPGNV